MDILIKKFKIIEIPTRKYNEFNFTNGINIISGKNKHGKSTLTKSIMHTLGFEVKKWANDYKTNDFLYKIILQIEESEYSIIRYKNYFIVDDKIMDLKKYRVFLSEILNIKIRFKHKSDNNEVNEIIPYPSDIFLYSYIDQDSSFNEILYKNNYKNYFYQSNEWKNMFKYYVGIYNEDLYNLEKEYHNLGKEIGNLNKKIKDMKEWILSLGIKEEDYISIDENEFKEEIKIFTEKILEITNKKNQLELKKLVETSKLRSKELEKLNLEFIYSNLEKDVTCQLCHSKIDDTFIEYYKKELNKQYVLESYSLCLEEIEKINNEIEKLDKSIDEIANKLKIIKNLKGNKEKYFQLDDIIKKNANLRIIININTLIKEMSDNILTKQALYNDLREKISKIKGNLKIKNDEINDYYKEELKRISKYFLKSELDSFQDKFLDFNVKGTGASVLLKKISLYFVYTQILIKYSKIKFPLIWDSIIKEAIDGENDKDLNDFVNNEIFNLSTQIIFTNISGTTKDIKITKEDVNIINISNRGELLNYICFLDNTTVENKEIDKIFKLFSEYEK